MKWFWVSWDLQKPDILENNTTNSGNNVKFQINNKKKWNISFWSYTKQNKQLSVLTYFIVWENNEKSSWNNQSTWCLPPKYERDIFQKKLFLGDGGQTFLGKLAGRELFYMRGLMIRSMPSGQWGHSLHLPPPTFFCWGNWTSNQMLKKRSLRGSLF